MAKLSKASDPKVKNFNEISKLIFNVIGRLKIVEGKVNCSKFSNTTLVI